jgi:hypothetical protein
MIAKISSEVASGGENILTSIILDTEHILEDGAQSGVASAISEVDGFPVANAYCESG